MNTEREQTGYEHVRFPAGTSGAEKIGYVNSLNDGRQRVIDTAEVVLKDGTRILSYRRVKGASD